MNDTERREWNAIRPRLYLVFIVLGIAFFMMYLLRGVEEKQSRGDTKRLERSLKDTIEKRERIKGVTTRRISVLTNNNIVDFLKLENQKEEIVKLQKEVAFYKDLLKIEGSVTSVSTTGAANGNFPSVTTNKDSSPVYKSDFNFGDWIWGSTVASDTSTTISFQYREDLSIALYREKTGLFGLGKGVPYAEVKLNNPYSSLSSLRTYQVTESRTKKFVFGPGVYYGIGPNFSTGVYVGVGLSYNLFSF